MAVVAGFTLPGERYGKLNQDWHAVCKLGSGKKMTRVCAVLDGHGLFGELVARVCGENLMKYLTENLLGCDDAEVEILLRGGFAKAHDAGMELYSLERLPEKYQYPTNAPHTDTFTVCKQGGDVVAKDRCGDAQLVEFGATCTVLVLRGNNLWVAHVGDSSAVIGVEGSGEMEGSFLAEPLTSIHNGFNQSEVERVKKRFSPFSNFTDDGYIAVSMGMWEGTQLGMTRSLSHKLLLQHGVIPDPEVSHRTLRRSDCILIVASDGLWDNVSMNEAVSLVASSADEGAEDAVHELVEHAVKLAKEGFPQDNTTAIVLLLD
mmetsp:Transcript_24980/g.34431  ORF Transcript_24980/g.34431 Transcript_24980/m.34431 type:complete len:318 (+) Transcript_24980:175-1128(+)